jgi:hypothetical protein
MRLAESIAHMGGTEICKKFLSGTLKGRDNFRELGVVGKIILKLILEK